MLTVLYFPVFYIRAKEMEVYKTRVMPVFCVKVKFGVLTIGRCMDGREFNSKS